MTWCETPATHAGSSVFAGLVGAIAWNLITWYFGLPSSSSHALIGGMVGAVFVAEGPGAVFFEEGVIGKVMIPAVVAPFLAFTVGGLAILFLYQIVGRLRPGPVDRRLPARPGASPAACSHWRTARTTRRRRWA